MVRDADGSEHGCLVHLQIEVVPGRDEVRFVSRGGNCPNSGKCEKTAGRLCKSIPSIVLKRKR